MFPIAFAINSFSMTGLFIAFGFIGRPELAADIAIVQGATLALFFAFSANARNLILNQNSNSPSVSSLLHSRIVLILPLGIASYILSAGFTQISTFFIALLIIRKWAEWFSELHLSWLERNNRQFFAKIYILVQLALLLSAYLCKLLAPYPFADLGILLWAIIPLVMDAKFIASKFDLKKLPYIFSTELLPHFGSTATTGITVFIFRLSLTLLYGRLQTGDLLTAFAVGGLISTIYNTAIGPTLALKKGQVRPIVSKLTKSAFSINLLAGLLIVLTASELPLIFSIIEKSQMFWTALGSSMIGGCIMTLSLRIRIELLQHEESQDVFGQDLMINLVILTFTLFSFYIFGEAIGAHLFLFNAFVSFVVYGTSKYSIFSLPPSRKDQYLLIGMIVLFVFPIFFQLQGHIYNDPEFVSKGSLFELPIPFSSLICFGAIVLIGKYENSKASLYVIFFSFVAMIVAILALRQVNSTFSPLDKIILMIQFMLPMFAMVFGQMFFRMLGDIKILARAVFFTIGLTMIAQIIATYAAGIPYLTPYMYFFSIYQNLQYVPTIFIALYFLSLYALWDDPLYRKFHMIVSPFVGAYAMLSMSMATMLLLFLGLAAFVFSNIFKGNWRMPVFYASVVLLALISTQAAIKNTDVYLQKFDFEKSSLAQKKETDQQSNSQSDNGEGYRSNTSTRMQIWEFYLKGVLNHPFTFVFGNFERPDRAVYPSAHNYYLDFIYNFGFIAMVPMAILLVSTLALIYQNKKIILNSQEMIGLVLIVIFLLSLDNSVKVSLRQPYPGIITFFLWGLLFSRLSNERRHVS